MATEVQNRAGDVLSETEVSTRIDSAIQSIKDLGADDLIRLHNLVCKGEIALYVDKHESLLDAGGEPIKDAEAEDWIYVFTKDES